MNEFWKLLGPATNASLIMAPIHALFGLHIVRRGLIFIDLAVAQVAALGMSLAIALGNEPQSAVAYRYSIGFALGGALLISLTRFRLGRVPHEAIIGIVYVLSTAASIIVLDFAPTGHGMEELKNMLAGNIVFVSENDLVNLGINYGIILVLLVALWKPITSMSLSTKSSIVGWKAILMDFAFYALLGFMVAQSVRIAGVLVVFSWLVVPAVIAFFFVEKMLRALLIALPLGIVGSILGLYLSYKAPAISFGPTDPNAIESAGAGGWPTGPSIVAALGAMVVAAYIARVLIPSREATEAPIENETH